MFRFPSPDWPIFLEKWKKKKKNSRITCKEGTTLIYKHTILSNTNCLKLSSILRFVAFLDIFYHLIISCRLNVRFNMQSCVHSFFFFFARPTDRPTFTWGRAMGNETFYGGGLTISKQIVPKNSSASAVTHYCGLHKLQNVKHGNR